MAPLGRLTVSVVGLLSVLAGSASGQDGLTAHQALARELYSALIGINTTHSSGSTTEAARAMAQRLIGAGFPEADVRVLGPNERKGNLVARLRGRDATRPAILLLAHLDVVEADSADRTVDPFSLLERDGYFYGRGTTDDKDEAAIWTAVLIRLHQEGYVPDRDVILALPQRASATVNCRMLPGTSPESVRAALIGAAADDAVRVTPLGTAQPSPPSPLLPDIMQAIEQVTRQMWPGVRVIPTMSTGATDGLYLRRAGIPVYGVSGIFTDVDDVRAHGQDERLLVRSFYEGLEFCYRLLRTLTAGGVP